MMSDFKAETDHFTCDSGVQKSEITNENASLFAFFFNLKILRIIIFFFFFILNYITIN